MQKFAAYVDGEENESLVVFSKSGRLKIFIAYTIHISCQSDPYRGSRYEYGGIILYGQNGQDDWRTANGTHCKSGYIVILRTDTTEFAELQSNWSEEPGKVHGIIYRKAFGESCKDVKVVGEGFGIMNGEFKTISGAFNPVDDGYHDSSCEMNPKSTHCVKKVVEWWISAGRNFVDCRNHKVKDLLSSYED